MVELAEGGVDGVLLVQSVPIAVVAVLDAVEGDVVYRVEPALIDDPAEAVDARVLVAGVAIRFAGLLDHCQLHSGLGLPPNGDSQPEVADGF